MNPLVTFVKKVPLIEQIAIGLVIGIMLAVFVPSAVPFVSIFGDLFVSALKGVAPVLVFILVMNAMTQRKSDGDTNMKPIVTLYVLGTFAALSCWRKRCPFSFLSLYSYRLKTVKSIRPAGLPKSFIR